MNYAAPYIPNYGAPAAAYAQPGWDQAAIDAYAQAQQQAAALDQLQQMYGGGSPYDAAQQPQYAMTWTGQSTPGTMVPTGAPAAPGGAMVAAAPPNLTPMQAAWWQQPTYGIPRWGLAAGALALTGIGLAWQAGMFGGKDTGRSSSRSTTRRSTARDASRGRSTTISRTGPKGRTTTLSTHMDSDSERDMSRGRRRSRKSSTKRSTRSRRRR